MRIDARRPTIAGGGRMSHGVEEEIVPFDCGPLGAFQVEDVVEVQAGHAEHLFAVDAEDAHRRGVDANAAVGHERERAVQPEPEIDTLVEDAGLDDLVAVRADLQVAERSAGVGEDHGVEDAAEVSAREADRGAR